MNQNTSTEIFAALRQLERDRGIPVEYMTERITQALLAAYKKDHTGYTENVMVSVVDGELKMFVQKEAVEELMFPDTEITLEDARKYMPDAVEGDIVTVEIDAKQFGRIAAKTAKDVIIQGIREAEHTVIYDKFNSKAHEMITGEVVRVEPDSGDMLIRIATGAAGTGNGTDKTNALLAAGEQVRGESYTEGDSIRVYVVDVRRSSHGPQVIVSRTHPGLVKRLFEREVPEIADGTVEVKSIAREAGNRTKLAVWSSDPDVDAVGTCVGPRGGRVGAVVDELGGEKMDIIQYSEDPAEFVAAALSPADVVEVLVQPGTKNCRVVVPDDQLSLAIGKEGQNARLAARLTGYKIDIKAESDADALNFGEEEPLPEEPEDVIPEDAPETEAEITE